MFKLARELTTSSDMYTVCIKDIVITFPVSDKTIFNIVRLDIWRGKEFKSLNIIDDNGIITADKKDAVFQEKFIQNSKFYVNKKNIGKVKEIIFKVDGLTKENK